MSQTRLKQFENWLLYILLFSVPLILFPSVSNPFVTAKIVTLTVLLSLICIVKVVRNLTSKTKGLVFSSSQLDLPVLLLAIAYFVSGYFTTPNKLEAFWLPGNASFILAGAILFFVTHQLTDSARNMARIALLLSGVAVAFVSILVTSGILKSMTGLPAYVRSDFFSPSGSVLVSAVMIVALIPMVIDIIVNSKDMLQKSLAGVTIGLFALAGLIALIGITKNWNSNQAPSLATSWIVATESLKNRPFTGVGPGNYLSAFNRFIPISYNATEQWSVRFSNASNFYLTAVTETGLLGLAALAVLLLTIFRVVRKANADRGILYALPLIIITLAFAVFPASPSLIVLFFAILGLSTKTHVVHLFTPQSEEHSATSEGKVAAFIVAIPVIALALFTSYLVMQEMRGEVRYQRALNAINAQDGRAAYDTLRSAIAASPYNDRYHVAYAQLNLVLANALTQKETLNDDEKNTISQLVQQAVREGRNSAALNRERSGNWAVLGSVYRAVIPLAKGADQFAIQAYAQAIALDPTNPNLRIGLGGIFYGLKRYEEAIDAFKLAAATKPDLANAHYNLAIAYRDNGQYDRALAELSGTLTLVKKDSKDYEAIQKEIANVQSKAPKKAEGTQTENLTPPTNIEDNPVVDEKIDLPEDATPAANVDTSATPVATATPTPAGL